MPHLPWAWAFQSSQCSPQPQQATGRGAPAQPEHPRPWQEEPLLQPLPGPFYSLNWLHLTLNWLVIKGDFTSLLQGKETFWQRRWLNACSLPSTLWALWCQCRERGSWLVQKLSSETPRQCTLHALMLTFLRQMKAEWTLAGFEPAFQRTEELLPGRRE